MANINTLVKDIQDTILGLKGWDNVLGLKMGHNIAKSASLRFNKPQKARGYLSFSSIGSPCKRKLWYKINHPQESKQPDASDLLKFFYGDIIEELILVLAQVAGHEVTGQQDRLKIAGLAGHRDAVIDGMTVDVKSASPYGFTKFVDSSLRDNDPFGSISQLSSYVYAAQNDPLVTNKTHGAFLVVNKSSGEIHLDVYDFSQEIEQKEFEISKVKNVVKGNIPDRPYEPEPESDTSPNTKLPKACGWCEFKKKCWPEARRFVYGKYDKYLIDVVKEPHPKYATEDLTYNVKSKV
jgi:hypothetical protein